MSAPDLLPFAGWAVEALVASTLLMLVVLLVRAPVRRAFGPDIAYALWALPVLRLALPPLPQSWHAATVAPVLRATEQVTVLFVDAAPVAAPSGSALASTIAPALAILWVVGAAAFALWHTFVHHRFCARMLADAGNGDTIGSIRVIESAAASGPLAFGVWRRYVAFPRDVAERYDAEERALALAHELGHHARGDLLANWIALAVLALHWFNPVAWRAFRTFRADQEIANDARVLAGRSAHERHVYACAIVKAAHSGAVSAACHLHTITDLKGRLTMLATSPTSRRRLASGTAAVGALAIASLGLTASGSGAAAINRGVEQAVAQATLAGKAADFRTSAVDSATAAADTAIATADTAMSSLDSATSVADSAQGPAAAPSGSVDGRAHKVIRIIRTRAPGDATARDGKRDTFVMRDGPAGKFEIKDIPEIAEAKCGTGPGKPNVTVIEGKDGAKRRMIICTDRIERIAADGAAIAANSKDIERSAYLQALTGLRVGRARLADNPDMTAEFRKTALDGIDEAIRELEEDMSKAR